MDAQLHPIFLWEYVIACPSPNLDVGLDDELKHGRYKFHMKALSIENVLT